MNHRVFAIAVPALAVAWLASAPALRAEEAGSEGELVRVSASERYEAGRVHRLALGGGYRDLWEQQIELPLLDPATFAGGLEVTGRFGGLQTAVLGLRSADGRAFTFRGVDKDPSAVLPEDLRGTVIQALVQDMMAAQHPAAPIAVSPIAEAAGLLAIEERMVVMQDSPALGPYREEFAGMVGTFYEFPQPAGGGRAGFHGATEIIDHRELYARLTRGYADRVAVDAFLRARLFDILIGDFDRHRKQWRWAQLPGDPRWHPIPEDRDMGFVRYEGVGPRTAYLYVPILQDYGPEYPWIKGLTLHGWEQDRFLLPALSWDDWERVAKDLQARVSDEVIERGITALPTEYQELDGERLRRALRGRRDHLLEGARAFYEHLAGEVAIQGTDLAEEVRIVRRPGGSTLVELRLRDAGPDAEPVFSRAFSPADTNEVRLFLRGGDDRVRVSGGDGGPQIRIVAGSPDVASSTGRKLVDDRQGGDLLVYDEHGVVELEAGPGTRVDARHWTPPPPDPGFVDVADVPARDWGWDLVPVPQFGYERDVGAFLGLGLVYTKYGFRAVPWSQRHRVSGGYATGASTGRFAYGGRFRFENSDLMATLDGLASGIEILRYYGTGNGTGDSQNQGFYRAKAAVLRLAPGLALSVADDVLRMSGGPWLQWTRTKQNDRLVDQDSPYGDGKFGMVGLRANLQVDTRRSLVPNDEALQLPLHDPVAAGYPISGFLFDVTGSFSPPLWDVDEGAWGSVGGSISAYETFFERFTLGARFGGRETFGDVPYFESATIGGGHFFHGGAQVRGLRADRFRGDSSMYGNLDLRVYLARLKIVVPSDVGVVGFVDTGRVWGGADRSSTWHTGAGGGFWIAPLARTNAISMTVAKSDEDTLFYLHLGFQF